MNTKSLKLNILIIFSIPLIAIVFFSYKSITTEYNKQNETSVFKFSVYVTQTLNELAHNIQLERGLSSGYLVATDKELSLSKLKKQYNKTDLSITKLLAIVNLKSNEKSELEKLIAYKAKPLIYNLLEYTKNIDNIREMVKNAKISFEDEIKYYSDINKNIILAVKVFHTIFKERQGDAMAVVKIQELKEYAGLERAHIYNQLLSPTFDDSLIQRLKELKLKQENLIDEFFINASLESTKIYNTHYNEELKRVLDDCINGVINKKMTASEAERCFEVSTNYINSFDLISTKILNSYVKKSNTLHKESTISLYITSAMWFISFFTLIFLTNYLRQLIKKQEDTTEQLRISSYAFDAQEAMTITDTDGTILKINKAFTAITGYKPSEAIGQNTRILKSSKHPKEFYENMWKELINNGKWHNEIFNKRKSGEIYPEMLSITAIKDENNITTNYIAQFIDISEIKKAKELAEHQADHDFLTGLLNRKALIARLSEEFMRAKKHDFLHAFLFIDLDNFKYINDYHGHQVGDMLIIEVSNRIKKAIREENIASRISGDEFGILLLDLDSDKSKAAMQIEKIANKLLKAISKEFILNSHKIKISSSIGIRIFPDNEKKVNDIITHADKAMYEAKKDGKNRFVFFSNKLENELKQFYHLKKEILDSLKKDNFTFYYQPKVDTNIGFINGAEMLIRWNHPEKGLVFPGDFIDTAEAIGVIHKFTSLALHKGCSFIESHKEIFYGTMSINISSKELLQAEFENKVIDIVSSYDIKPSSIELELTETSIIKDFDLAVARIKRLQEFGIKFSIDDFGTGYSSISYMQKLPVNTLKIDRGFLQNLSFNSNKELVKLIINMAKAFNMTTVTEGIEDQQQLDFVKENGADMYQGFYFSKAVDEESFANMLKK